MREEERREKRRQATVDSPDVPAVKCLGKGWCGGWWVVGERGGEFCLKNSARKSVNRRLGARL
ncbi:hypothetical protein E2C01_053491 [Portunus trituberculatus]|uniref:Uncharacterized protein n=1 Tax=Portunus trituberculatus TaxID=210409 RepID=A0A5B7GKH5_PORTR|nr:hypothetical protein [Portunus trituberculatus]